MQVVSTAAAAATKRPASCTACHHSCSCSHKTTVGSHSRSCIAARLLCSSPALTPCAYTCSSQLRKLSQAKNSEQLLSSQPTHLLQQEGLECVRVAACPEQPPQCRQPWVCGPLHKPSSQQRLLVHLGLWTGVLCFVLRVEASREGCNGKVQSKHVRERVQEEGCRVHVLCIYSCLTECIGTCNI